jgi:hypothetical protein
MPIAYTVKQPMRFELHACRFWFETVGTLRFPPKKAGNTFRGALGTFLQSRIFEPRLDRGPSGLADAPRPFVIRAAALDGCAFSRGDTFSVDVHLFDPLLLEHFTRALSELERSGLGAARTPVALRRVEDRPVSLCLAAKPPAPVRTATVRFLTPTELKTAGEVARDPVFEVLFSRIRDRISTLRQLYGDGPLAIDFRALAERAARIRMTRCDLRWEQSERRSSRTGQVHPIGGFTGEAAYEGDLDEFLPYLEAAWWTGVGRQTVWGKGAIRLQLPTP